MDPGQAQALTGCSVPPAICHGGSSRAPAGWVCGPGGQGYVMGWWRPLRALIRAQPLTVCVRLLSL